MKEKNNTKKQIIENNDIIKLIEKQKVLKTFETGGKTLQYINYDEVNNVYYTTKYFEENILSTYESSKSNKNSEYKMEISKNIKDSDINYLQIPKWGKYIIDYNNDKNLYEIFESYKNPIVKNDIIIGRHVYMFIIEKYLTYHEYIINKTTKEEYSVIKYEFITLLEKCFMEENKMVLPLYFLQCIYLYGYINDDDYIEFYRERIKYLQENNIQINTPLSDLHSYKK